MSSSNFLTSNSFRADEALELAAALTASIAEQSKVRCLFIKGPAAVEAGMRPARPSADIDVLVHPEHVDSLVDQLCNRGWKLRPFPEGMGIPKHSHTAYHPEWPIDIDIHFRFPGLDAEPSKVFERLYGDAVCHLFGGVKAKVPSIAGMLIIQITHALRYWDHDGRSFETAQSDYDFLIRKSSPMAWDVLRPVLDETRSWAAMKPFLLQQYPMETKSIDFPLPSEDWLSRTVGTFDGKLRAVAFLNAPMVEKPKILLRSLFPSREDLAAGNLPLLEAEEWVLVKHRVARLLRFVQQIPLISRKLARIVWKKYFCPDSSGKSVL